MIRAAMILQLCYFAALGWAAGDRIRHEAESRAIAVAFLSLPLKQLSEYPL